MKQITACVDGSNGAAAVCDAGSWASTRLEQPLQLLHVLEKQDNSETNLSGSIGLGSREHLLQQLTELDAQRARLALESGRLMLDAAQVRAQQSGASNVTSLQRHGRLSEEVTAIESTSSLLVLGRLGEDHIDPQAATLGSQLETVLRTVQCPVLITTGAEFTQPRSFMVAYDGSEASQRALDAYASGDLLKGLPCHLVMVNHTDEAHVSMFNAAAERLRSEGFDVTTARLEGEVQPVLADYRRENDIDLIVMGAYGHSRIRQFFVGSHTRNMVSLSEVPLLLLR